VHPVQVPRHTLGLQREFGLRGRVTLGLHETVQPVVVVADVREPQANPTAFQGRVRFAAGISGAVSIPHLQLINPSAPGGQSVIVLLREMVLSNNAPPALGLFVAGRRDAALPAGIVIGVGNRTNFQITGPAAATILADSATNARTVQTAANDFMAFVGDGLPRRFNLEGYVLPPGTGWVIEQNLLGGVMEVSLDWDEFVATP